MTRRKPLPILAQPDASLHETLAVVTQRDFLSRRGALHALGAAALIASPLAARAACSLIPTETGGPFPGDGTNGPNVLTQSGSVRSDIRASFGSAGSSVAPARRSRSRWSSSM